MAITARALLRKWFGRGMYPTAEQFSSVFDSFWHKEEDRIAINQIDGLPEQLNGKFSAADGERLEGAIVQVADDLEQHRTEANEAIDQLRESCIRRTERLILHGGTPGDLVNNA